MNTTESKEIISITGLLRVVYKSKKTVALFLGIFMVLGLMIYLFSPKEFSSQAVILRENTQSGVGLGRLASLAGINIGRLDDKGRTLNSAVYEPILRSSPFLDKILKSEYDFSDIGQRLTLMEYLAQHTTPSLTEALEKVVSLSWLRSGNTPAPQPTEADTVSSDDVNAVIFDNSIIEVSSRKAIKDLRGRIYYSKDLQTGLITISLDLQDANGGAQVLQKMIGELVQITRKYQGQRDSLNIEQLDVQINEKKSEYEKALEANARFRDQNINLVRSMDRMTEQKLQNEITFAFNVYNTLLQQREQIIIQSRNMQDPIAIIEPVQIAGGPSSPNIIPIMAICIFFGLVFGVLFVLVKNSFVEIIR